MLLCLQLDNLEPEHLASLMFSISQLRYDPGILLKLAADKARSQIQEYTVLDLLRITQAYSKFWTAKLFKSPPRLLLNDAAQCMVDQLHLLLASQLCVLIVSLVSMNFDSNNIINAAMERLRQLLPRASVPSLRRMLSEISDGPLPLATLVGLVTAQVVKIRPCIGLVDLAFCFHKCAQSRMISAEFATFVQITFSKGIEDLLKHIAEISKLLYSFLDLGMMPLILLKALVSNVPVEKFLSIAVERLNRVELFDLVLSICILSMVMESGNFQSGFSSTRIRRVEGVHENAADPEINAEGAVANEDRRCENDVLLNSLDGSELQGWLSALLPSLTAKSLLPLASDIIWTPERQERLELCILFLRSKGESLAHLLADIKTKAARDKSGYFSSNIQEPMEEVSACSAFFAFSKHESFSIIFPSKHASFLFSCISRR